jgi:RNA polymerase sigma-70 factor (ECF subfamily)
MEQWRLRAFERQLRSICIFWQLVGRSLEVDEGAFCANIDAVAKVNDRGAFSELFRFFAPRFKAYALRSGCGDKIAEKIAQEAMISVWRQAGAFDRTTTTASTWMFTILRNTRIEHFRHERENSAERDEAEPRPAGIVDPNKTHEAVTAGKNIRNAVTRLPAEQSVILQKAFFECKSLRAIAEELKLPLATVTSRTQHALTHLRKGLSETCP